MPRGGPQRSGRRGTGPIPLPTPPTSSTSAKHAPPKTPTQPSTRSKVSSAKIIPRVRPYAEPQSIRPSYRPSPAWSPDEDRQLVKARGEGMHFIEIARAFFPNKTETACRKRYKRVLERIRVEEKDIAGLDRLAAAYMEMREETWSPIANKLNVPWDVIESKVKSCGVAGLETAARLAAQNCSASTTNRYHRQSNRSEPSPDSARDGAGSTDLGEDVEGDTDLYVAADEPDTSVYCAVPSLIGYGSRDSYVQASEDLHYHQGYPPTITATASQTQTAHHLMGLGIDHVDRSESYSSSQAQPVRPRRINEYQPSIVRHALAPVQHTARHARSSTASLSTMLHN